MSKMTGLSYMKKTYPSCCKTHNGKIITLQEKQSKIIFSNPGKTDNIIFKLDGCVVKDSTTRRCDFLLYDYNETEHFIELKGRSIMHAIDQLKTSVQKFGVENRNRRKYCFVACSGVQIPQISIGNYVSYFKRNFNAILAINSSVKAHSLPSLTQ